MKRFFAVSIFLLGCISFAGAKQVEDDTDAKLMLVSKFNKNWEFNAGIGIQSYLGEYSADTYKLKDWWSPALDLSINKWASPHFGIGLGLNVTGYKGLYGLGDAKKATFIKDDDEVYDGSLKEAKGAYTNLFVKGNADLTNLFWGWNPERKLIWTGYVGGGVLLPISDVTYRSLGASFNAGLSLQYRLRKKFLIGATIRGALYSDGFNGISYLSADDHDNIPLDGMIGATVGVAYKFGYAKRTYVKTGESIETEWVPAATAIATSATVANMIKESVAVAEEAKDKEIAAINDKLDKETAAVEQLKSENEVLRTVKDVKPFWTHISFKIDKWTIINNERVDLLSASEYIKSCPEEKFVIRGYADKQTATPEHNEMLSKNRAEAVKKALVEEFGVNADQLEVEYYGGVDYMYFSDAKCSRCVIIKNK